MEIPLNPIAVRFVLRGRTNDKDKYNEYFIDIVYGLRARPSDTITTRVHVKVYNAHCTRNKGVSVTTTFLRCRWLPVADVPPGSDKNENV